MRMILHTLRKDVRRLWPVAAITWVMLGVLSGFDRWRADWTASPTEGWLTMLLTMAFALVAALAVLEEPLVGDSNFWTTRPHRWPELFAAKLAFVALAIHLPSLIADAYVVAARGFFPFAYLGPLLWKQFLFFAAVVLPAMAVASLIRSFTHFVILMFAIAGGITILNGGFQIQSLYLLPGIAVRQGMIRILVALAALAVVWLQYSRRRVIPSRVIAAGAMLAAASIYLWLPARAEYELVSRPTLETLRVAFRNSPSADYPGVAFGRAAQQVALLPIEIAPAAPGQILRDAFADVEVVGPGGAHLQSGRPSPNRPFEKIDLMAYPLAWTPGSPESDYYAQCNWLVLSFSSPAWERVKNARVRVRGAVAFDIVRRGQAVGLSLQEPTDASGVGRCSAAQVEDPYSRNMFKIFCESPREIPAAYVTLRHAASGREWVQHLNSSRTYRQGPDATWLSPLNRAQTFFHMTDSSESDPGSRWLVPASFLPSAQLEITPEYITGRALATFDFGEVSLVLLR
jgi:hypothetical protein